MTRIARMNMIIGGLGHLAMMACIIYFSSTLANFLISILVVSTVEAVAVHLYRKYRLKSRIPVFKG
ncbi:hypothetical membrane protein [Pseudomonas veronii 1YdBTEX2]|uniref:Uncharacterized protein n=2 Tax=Pseudomonas veronii TaxID=76761 RepID=A0A7Y1FBQ0_PSEVE|nr:hypothetical protein [Pseudomonas veronii]NMY12064.1 hypothetical protein [Pseudomonas veronii]SBW84106.1 hypothetical membrane protein [Pseudomonas veronii 1YdBTEX2]